MLKISSLDGEMVPVDLLHCNDGHRQGQDKPLPVSCLPGRAQLITGKHPVFHGANDLLVELDYRGSVIGSYIYVNYWDRGLTSKQVAFQSIEEGQTTFHVSVPQGAACAEFGIYAGELCDASIYGLRSTGIARNGLTIDMDNYQLGQNSNTRDFELSYEELAFSIPESNGCGNYKRSPLTVGIITDDFMYNYYNDAINLVYITPNLYKEQLGSSRIDFILYVSCWRGLNEPDARGEYEYAPDPSHALVVVPQIMEYAKHLGIKTVFQSIEDPPSYELYLPIARCCDYIFTSCVEKISDYVNDTCNEKVFYLGYGVNPILHNPVGLCKKYEWDFDFYRTSVFFAGSWYSRFSERCQDSKMLFDGVTNVLGKQLVIADRALDYQSRGTRTFPFYYNEYIIAPINHKILQKVHKIFNYSINLNSVKDSQTMGAMRVYEVQALGCLLLSNYALSIANAFPEVFMARDEIDFLSILENSEIEEILKLQLDGIRNVMTGYTVYDRLNWIFAHIGIPQRFGDKTIYFVCDATDAVTIESFERQTYEYKKLLSRDEIEGLQSDGYLILSEGPLPTDNTLQDIVNAFKYVDVDFINCWALAADRIEGAFDYCNEIASDAVVAYSLNKVAAMHIVSQDGIDACLGFNVLTS